MKLKNVLCTGLLTAALVATAWADIYVKNRPFEGQVSGKGAAALVEAEAMLSALGVTDYQLEGATLTINETTLTVQDGMVPLKALSDAVGAKVIVNSQLGTVDVYQEQEKVATVTGSAGGEAKGYTPKAMQKMHVKTL